MMDFLTALLSYKGRMGRKHYAAVNIGLALALVLLSKLHTFGFILPQLIAAPIFGVMGIIRLFCDIKRLRDFGQSAVALLFMAALLLFLPQANLQIIIIFTVSLMLIKSSGQEPLSSQRPAPRQQQEDGDEEDA